MRNEQLPLLSAPMPSVNDTLLREAHARLDLAVPVEVALATPWLRGCLIRSVLIQARRQHRAGMGRGRR